MTKTIAYTFFDSAKFMANLVNSLAEGIHKIKCKNEHIIKNAKRMELNTNIVTAFLYTQTLEII